MWLSLVFRPPALGWLVDLVEKSTVIIGTQGFQFRTALPGVNQQSLLAFSIGLPIRFTSRGGIHKPKESEKEIIVSIPPDAVTKVCLLCSNAIYHSFESNWACFCPILNFWNMGDIFKHLVLKYSKVWALEPSTFNTSCTLWSCWNLQHDDWHVHWLHVNCWNTSCWMSSCKSHALIFQVLFETCILHVLQILVHLQINLNIRQTCSAISSDIQQWHVLVIKLKKWKDKNILVCFK